ncbi:MAG: hypothetical protein OHK0021_01100 [Bryobacter sp.]
MESIYYVMSYLCHRTCEHCYEDRFRPYYGTELEAVLAQSQTNFPLVIRNLPRRMQYRDTEGQWRRGSIILAGGEILLPALRESVLYPGIRLLQEKYGNEGGVKIIVQTTGDTLSDKVASELRQLGVWMVSVSGIDAFHQGLETVEAQEAMKAKCSRILEAAGFEAVTSVAAASREPHDEGHYFHYFGATPDMWIGKLWPRGRAWRNGLSTAGLEDNFCNQWSGGLNFLNIGEKGSEVSIDPEGRVYPCCVKTKKAIGNLCEEPLENILARHRGNPVYEAISAGRPEDMGREHGWSREKFLEKSRTLLPDGRAYVNRCIGCDAFHDEVLMQELVQLAV